MQTATQNTGQNTMGKWSEFESEMLKASVAKHQTNPGPIQWTEVSAYLARQSVFRGATQCRHRWNKTMRPNIRKGSWYPEEDRILRKHVQSRLVTCTLQQINWQSLADDALPQRTGKACWERWIFRLDPSIDRSPFSPAQDNRLLVLHSELGNKWAKIAKCMSKEAVNGTRTADQIKSRYISLQRIVNNRSASPDTQKRDRSSSYSKQRPPKQTKHQPQEPKHLSSSSLDSLSIDIDLGGLQSNTSLRSLHCDDMQTSVERFLSDDLFNEPHRVDSVCMHSPAKEPAREDASVDELDWLFGRASVEGLDTGTAAEAQAYGFVRPRSLSCSASVSSTSSLLRSMLGTNSP